MLGCPKFIGLSIKLPKSDIRGSRRKCHALLARLEQCFNVSFPAPLDQQSAKKCRLQSEDEQRCKHKAPMLLGRERISLPGGSWLLLIPKRSSCRQSNTGLVKSPLITGIFEGSSPLRIRNAS